jgi:hypothetical protein
MGPLSYMQSVDGRNVVMRRMTTPFHTICYHTNNLHVSLSFLFIAGMHNEWIRLHQRHKKKAYRKFKRKAESVKSTESMTK